MTHLSDFSYLQRGTSFGYLFIWSGYRIWSTNRFQCFHPKRFRQGEMKSIVTLLVMIMMPFQMYYDIASTRIKYDEGFMNLFGHIINKPEIAWTEHDKNLVTPTNYSLCVGMALQAGTLLLFQCFWNYLSNAMAKESFMTSREFKFYIGWSIVSIIGFPFIQYNFSRDIYDPTFKEAMPEFAYGVQSTIISLMGIISHRRLSRLLEKTQNTPNGQIIQEKICHFQELNALMSTALFGFGSNLLILTSDSFTARKRLNTNKFTADFLICNVNICSFIVWFVVMLILHPQPSRAYPGQATQDYTSAYISGEKLLMPVEKVNEHKSHSEKTMGIPMEPLSPAASKSTSVSLAMQKSEIVTPSVLSSVTLVSPTSQFARQGSQSKDMDDHLETVVINDRPPFGYDGMRHMTTTTTRYYRRNSGNQPEIEVMPRASSPRRASCDTNGSTAEHIPDVPFPAGPSLPPTFTESQLPFPPPINPASSSSLSSESDHVNQIRRKQSADSMWLKQSPKNPTARPN